jgi:hypothetical protein
MKSRLINKSYNFLKPKFCYNLIRLGKNFDGGYIVCEQLIKKSDGLLSFGYGYDPSFELDYVRRTQNKVHIYDHTCNAIPLIQNLLKYFRRFLTFRKKINDVSYHFKALKNYFSFIKNEKIAFFKKKITGGGGGNNKIDINIRNVFNKLSNNNNLILKCDIEGSEYEIIEDIILYEKKICMMIFEFHWIDKKKDLFLEKIRKIQEYFSIIHIHGNNHFDFLDDESNIPIILEVTFVNNRNIILNKKNSSSTSFFPVANLDQPCCPLKDDLYFHFN